jgi:hypothetical protein
MQTGIRSNSSGFEVSDMLPSFRLIAAGFLCGFVVVFAGLRLATSLNNIHEALPIMAAQAAPAPSAGIGNARGMPGAFPVLYDMRFVASATAPLLASMTPHALERAITPRALERAMTPRALERAMPAPSLRIEDFTKDTAVAPAAPSVPVAAIDPAPKAPAPAAAVAPAALEPQPPAVAAIDPRPAPLPDSMAVEPAPSPAPVAIEAPPASDAAAVIPQPTPSPEPAKDAPRTEAPARTAAVDPQAPAPDTIAAEPAIEAPAALAAPQPQAAKPVRTKRARTVRRAPAKPANSDPLANSSGNQQ